MMCCDALCEMGVISCWSVIVVNAQLLVEGIKRPVPFYCSVFFVVVVFVKLSS